MYAKISNTKKGITLVGSVLIHLIVMVVLGVTFQNTSKNPRDKQFDLYAIKLLDVKLMSKNKLNSKSDNKKGKLVRKKKSNKAFPQKGKRQALAPKIPIKS